MKAAPYLFLALLVGFCASTRLQGQGADSGSAKRPRVALVLSGGSALGMAHAGVIEVIEEAGIPIDMVLGTSMGSIVGGLYAAGYSPAEMQDIVGGLDWHGIFSERRDNPGDRFDIQKEARFPLHLGFDGGGVRLGGGLLKGQHVLTLLTGLTLNILASRDFDGFPVPFRSVSADILTGEKVVFSSGSIAEAMRASMSIPGLFQPWEADGRLLVDGGIVDNMPVDIARSMGADIVIAVESRTQGAKSREALGSSLAISSQTLELFIEENMRPSRADADLLIRPDLSRFRTSSYTAARALIAIGKAAAEARRPELDALARRIAQGRELVTPATEPNRSVPRTLPLLSHVEIRGGGPEDRAFAASLFLPLAGHPLERASLVGAVDLAFASGRFDLVTFDLRADDPSPDGSGRPSVTGIVDLVPDSRARNEVMVGLAYRGVLSPLFSTTSSLRPGIYLGEPTGKDSALFVEAGLIGETRLRAEYFQPLGPLYLKPSLDWETHYDSWPINEGLGIRSYFRRAGGRLDAGLNLGKKGEVEVGWNLESVRASNLDDPSLGLTQESAIRNSLLGQLEARVEYTNYDNMPFPSKGLSFAASARWADPSLGGDTSYAAADIEAGLVLPLSRRLSLGLAAFAATDFSGFLPVGGQLPSVRWYSLRHRAMFHGIEARPAREIGNHALAAAVEATARIGRLSALLGGDLYGLANLSVGSVRVTDDPGSDFLPLRWDGCLGLGARVAANLGALVTVGVVYDGNDLAPLRPALSIELGSLSEYHEDRR